MEYKNEKLEEFNNFLDEKQVAIIGMGVSNIPLLDYFYDKNAKVTVFSTNVLSDEIMEKINKYRYEVELGEDNLSRLKGFDIIFRSPSALPTKHEFQKKKKKGAILTSEIPYGYYNIISIDNIKETLGSEMTLAEAIKEYEKQWQKYFYFVGRTKSGEIITFMFDLNRLKNEDSDEPISMPELKIQVIEESPFLQDQQGMNPDIAALIMELKDDIYTLNLDNISSNGYVVSTLESVLYIFLTSNDYNNTILRAINLGDDTDTIGSCTGGLLGFYYGIDSIKENWRKNILKYDYIIDLCNKFEKMFL